MAAMTDDPTYHVQITSDNGAPGSLELPVQLSTPPETDADGELLVPINPHKLTPAAKRAMRTIIFTFAVFFGATTLAFKTTADTRIVLARHVAATATLNARCEAWDEVHTSNQVAFAQFPLTGLAPNLLPIRINFNKTQAARLAALNKKLGPRPSC